MESGRNSDGPISHENDECDGAFNSELVVDGRTVNPSQISNTNLVVVGGWDTFPLKNAFFFVCVHVDKETSTVQKSNLPERLHHHLIKLCNEAD